MEPPNIACTSSHLQIYWHPKEELVYIYICKSVLEGLTPKKVLHKTPSCHKTPKEMTAECSLACKNTPNNASNAL